MKVGSSITACLLVGSCTFSPVSTLVVVPYAVDPPNVDMVSSDSGEGCSCKTIDGVFFVDTCVEGVGMAC